MLRWLRSRGASRRSVRTPLAIPRYFGNLKDPRRAPRHWLLDMMGIALGGVIAGANDWQQIVTFAEHRQVWLRRLVALPAGIPCHDTFERVLERLHARAFAAAFGPWMQALATAV